MDSDDDDRTAIEAGDVGEKDSRGEMLGSDGGKVVEVCKLYGSPWLGWMG